MTSEEVRTLLNDEQQSAEEKKKALRKARGQLLETIHEEQQLLDQLDYMLYSMKKTGGN